MSISNKNPVNNYIKYSSLAFQMGIIIFASTFGGLKLDDYLDWQFPVFTLIFSVLSVFLALYLALREFFK